jgi:hypothetical protein
MDHHPPQVPIRDIPSFRQKQGLRIDARPRAHLLSPQPRCRPATNLASDIGPARLGLVRSAHFRPGRGVWRSTRVT